MTDTSPQPGVSLYETVQGRVVSARERVEALDASDDVKRLALRHLDRLDRASRSDLTIASREVESFHAALDAGEVPIYD